MSKEDVSVERQQYHPNLSFFKATVELVFDVTCIFKF